MHHIQLTISLAVLQGKPLKRLQQLVDMLQVVRIGAPLVTEEIYVTPDFISVHPSANTRYALADAREASMHWLALHSLRDGIEAVAAFLEEARLVADFYRLAKQEPITAGDYAAVLEQGRQFHRLGLPEKVKRLESEFRIASPFARHLLSLNRARNCVVHRGGVVSPIDTDHDGVLTVTFTRLSMDVVEPDGTITPIAGPRLVDAGAAIRTSIGPTEKRFTLGECIAFTYDELFGAFFSMQQFINTVVAAVQQYAEGLGHTFPPPPVAKGPGDVGAA